MGFSLKKQEKEAKAIVEKFNKKFPVGSKVPHRKTGIDSIPFEDRILLREAFVSMSFEPVAYFEGLSGFYSIGKDFVNYK